MRHKAPGLAANVSPTYPLVATAAAGWSAATGAPADVIGVASGPLTWTGLVASRAAGTPNFLYVMVAGGALTTGSTLLPPVYQFGGTPSVTNGQFTFNIADYNVVGSERCKYPMNQTTWCVPRSSW